VQAGIFAAFPSSYVIRVRITPSAIGPGIILRHCSKWEENRRSLRSKAEEFNAP
jgi:hypothetical protein